MARVTEAQGNLPCVGVRCLSAFFSRLRRQARLFALAEHLRARRTGVTASELAQRFGVTIRTVYRDLDALREAQLPLSAERGRGGGYALDRNYSLPPVNFTAREAALLSALGRWATEARLVPFTLTLGSAIDKVRSALATSAQRELLGLMKELVFVGIPAHPAAPGVREAVEEAWFEHQEICVRYRSSDGSLSERTVHVRGITMDRALTLLHCTDVARDEPRTLRLDRILAVAKGHRRTPPPVRKPDA
jgi:predicted DNA-binding transcriptional regulator YafY